MIEEFIFPFIVGICVYLVMKMSRTGLEKRLIELIGIALLVAVIAVVAMVVFQLIGSPVG